jgi:cytochrome c-type biogenesis protein CcmH
MALPRLFVLLLALLFAALTVSACAARAPSLEERAFALDRQLMCPVCDGQTLDQSNSELARQMRQVIREKLAAGETDQQVRDYFSDPARYGPAVLAAPPASGFNLVLWMLPLVLALGGGLGIVLIMRALRRQAATRAPDVTAAPPNDRYLQQVDADLGLRAPPPPAASPRQPPGAAGPTRLP